MTKKIFLLIIGITFSTGVFAQSELNYKNGVWQNGEKIYPAKVRTLLAKNDEALSLYNSGRALYVTGQVIAFPCAFLMGWDLGTRLAKGEGNNVLLISGAVGTAIGLIMSLSGEGQMKKSVSLYNAAKAKKKEQFIPLEQVIIQEINLGMTQNGVGIIMSF
jgi:hypothetical protein